MFRKLLLFFLILGVGVAAWNIFGRPYREPGAYLLTEPAQRFTLAPPKTLRDYKIFPTAWYQLDALIVAKKDYDDLLSPVDLGVAWGPMADKDRLNQVSFRQSGRYLHHTGTGGLDAKTFSESVSNVHIIPANDAIRETVMASRRGDYISLKGSLVQVFGSGGVWSSSFSRKDTGDGACEVFYVTEATFFEPSRVGSARSDPMPQPDRAPPSNRISPSIAGADTFAATVVTARFPHEVELRRPLEIVVDEGSIVVPSGDRITLLKENESRTYAQYGDFAFWVDTSLLSQAAEK